MYRLIAALLLTGALGASAFVQAQPWTSPGDWPPPSSWNGTIDVVQSYTFNSNWGTNADGRTQLTIDARMWSEIRVEDSAQATQTMFSGSSNRDWAFFDEEAGCRRETHRLENGSGSASGPLEIAIGGPAGDTFLLNLGKLPELQGGTDIQLQAEATGDPQVCPQGYEEYSEQVPVEGDAYVNVAAKEMALAFWGSAVEMKMTELTSPADPDTPPVYHTSGEASMTRPVASPDADQGDTQMGQLTTTLKWDLQGRPQRGVLPREPLRLRGAYTFVMQVDPDGACGWPVTKFYWPVSIRLTSYDLGTALGSIVFPPTPGPQSNTWGISASPTRTELVPRKESPGPAGGEYDVVVDGGRWDADGLVRARDGRGQVTSGTASGARQILILRGSDQQWECRSDVKWSLLSRWVDLD